MSIVRTLLNSVARPNILGGQETYPLQIAAEYCPEGVVKIFIMAGTDINVRHHDDLSLYAAAGRELCAAGIMHSS